MAQFDKAKVASAAVNRSKLDLSSTHITSQSFMMPQPVYYRHMIPGEHIQGSGNVLTRLAPVAVPTYGRCRVNMRAFFVPFRLVFPNFNEFITDTIATNYTSASLVGSSPTLPNANIVAMYLNHVGTNDLCTLNANDNDPYDFNLGAGAHYSFTFFGRYFNKVLESLGYRMMVDTKDGLTYSALPILCYAKAWSDWYANSAYLDSSAYLAVQKLFKFNSPASSLVLSGADLYDILTLCMFCCYDKGSDVFTNAWDNPVAPNSGLYSSGISMTDITANPNNTVVSLDSNGTPVMSQTVNTQLSVGSTYIHQMLKSMTDFIKRNQLSGAYAVDRFLTRFGLNLDSSKVDRSIYIASQSVDVDFGSVMSHTNTASGNDPSTLGDYAGQGLGRGTFGFDYRCDEFGLFVVLSSIIPSGSLYQGFDRNNLHVDKMDFYQPEFDNLGVQAIARGEVYVSRNSSYGNSTQYGLTFGYAPRLYEYKQKTDFVTGDFVSPVAYAGGQSWHLNRYISDIRFLNVGNQVHSLDFTRGVDFEFYNRIFNYTGLNDKFYNVYHFAVQSLAPCKSLFDTYEFDEDGLQLSMDSNGSKVN